ncbi:MAG: hypothetical protein COX57_11225 [Alphaproteobacteria bacterium CG_4_10_14_0_2_um_filter_63_37]|nr:MAG: hypothetical protein AUJ55_08670 [Proteobacteria bacterium CG1_02_64_396]PJA23869.1 MAG: hypothetical protein COX57_11225 [Alphaproteobacteria bacterium CG_4_10_14_0_2_um_filter_63_37]
MKPWIAISACLLGEPVRYDGNAKPSAAVQKLAESFAVALVCPEVEAGLGVPRPPVRLVAGKRLPKAVGVDDPGLDVTEVLVDHAIAWLLNHEQIDGVVFKARSPSCGLGSTPVLDGDGKATLGSGLFARTLMRQRPWLPASDEEGLSDPAAADRFAKRVWAAYRLRTELAADCTPDRLLEFHTRHKPQFLAHAPERCADLDAVVAGGITFVDYRRRFMAILGVCRA